MRIGVGLRGQTSQAADWKQGDAAVSGDADRGECESGSRTSGGLQAARQPLRRKVCWLCQVSSGTWFWATGQPRGGRYGAQGRRQDGRKADAKTASEHLAPFPCPGHTRPAKRKAPRSGFNLRRPFFVFLEFRCVAFRSGRTRIGTHLGSMKTNKAEVNQNPTPAPTAKTRRISPSGPSTSVDAVPRLLHLCLRGTHNPWAVQLHIVDMVNGPQYMG